MNEGCCEGDFYMGQKNEKDRFERAVMHGDIVRMSRRGFLGGCAACAAGLAGVSAIGFGQAMAQEAQSGLEKARVRVFFTHKPPSNPTWPNIGYDYDGRKKVLLEKLQNSCTGIEFLPVTVGGVQRAKEILAKDKDENIDGYVVYMVGIWTGVPQEVMQSGRPTILIDDLYGGSGEFLSAYSDAKRRDLKVTGVSSSRFEDVAEAVKCFECLKKLRSSAILRVGTGFGCTENGVQNVFGTKIVHIQYEQLNDAYVQADKTEAKKWADKWINEAEKVVEPGREEIEKSAAMYLAMKKLMDENKAQAITINCLGGFYGGKIRAYPCLGFFQLNNDGLVGACESDLKSTITMLIIGYLTGRPGYISDPVIDTSKNQIIYAHCVAMNRVYGPDGKTNPYHIRNHSEDRKGAAIRSLLPLGEMTTSLEFDPDKKEIIIHRAKTVENVEEDKACRTKLAAEPVGDINKLLRYWDTWGWHRVTFYGDLRRPVEHIATLTGFKIIEEA
jgi:hypothetical protein